MDNPFIFGEVVDQDRFVDREQELDQLMRDVADGQKVFLLSPRRFGKSSLVGLAFLKLRKRHIRTVIIEVSSYANYIQFLEKFAEKVLRAAGPWEKVRDWIGRFLKGVRPQASYNLQTGAVNLALSGSATSDATPFASEIFALPGELATHGGFRMAICLDEFQQILHFDGDGVENALRNAIQRQREVGYVFSGSQPSLLEDLLSPKRPLHKSGPRYILDKIPAKAWRLFIQEQFRQRKRTLSEAALAALLEAADLIPYDVQRVAHELWDYAELKKKPALDVEDVNLVLDHLVARESTYYERMWEQLTSRQRAVLQALANQGSGDLFAQESRQRFGLGPASSVQRALQALVNQDVLDRYQGRYFLLDPLLGFWIRKKSR